MNNRDEIMRKRFHLIGSIFSSIISIPILLILMFLINEEYVEYTRYGQIVPAKITDYKIRVQMGESSNSPYFIRCKTIQNNISNIKQVDTVTFQVMEVHSFFKDEDRQFFLCNFEIGDIVKIQLINKREARLLKWKNWQANQPASIKTKFWMFLIIIVLLVVFIGLNHRVYKLIRKK